MNVYFSFPVAMVDREKFYNDCVNKLCNSTNNEISTYMWKQKFIYNESRIENCDVFIFRGITNNWTQPKSILPSGVKKELEIAIKLKKKIYLMYTDKQGGNNFYRTDVSGGIITGIGGTSHEIYEFINTYSVPTSHEQAITNVKINSQPIAKHFTYDIRLLLS